MIRYQHDLKGLTPDQLTGFFVGWPNPPDRDTHWKIMQGSDEIVIAIDDASGAAAGFITAITDGVLAAYIPLLEVRPDYQGRGIGRELTRQMLQKLAGYYMIDLITEQRLQRFYEPLGLRPQFAMVIRDFKHQNGRRHNDSPIV